MTEVSCWNDDCLYCENNVCTKSEITLTDRGCDDYLDYYDADEYQSIYWKRVQGKNKNVYRVKSKGKKIVINGIDFYTESNTCNGDMQTYLTDGRTGMFVGQMKALKAKYWKTYETGTQNISDVADLPVGVYDRDKHTYVGSECE